MCILKQRNRREDSQFYRFNHIQSAESKLKVYFNEETDRHDAAECHYFSTVLYEVYQMSHGLFGEDVQTVSKSLRQVP